MRQPSLAVAALLCLAACGNSQSEAETAATPPVDREAATAAVNEVLDDFHHAAAEADEERYFAHFTDDGVFLGTDATERWDVPAFREYAHPHFAAGEAWDLRPTRREVMVSDDGAIAWFDEDLDSDGLGPCRGSGVLRRGDDGVYRVAHYNLTITVPNERFAEVRDLLRGPPRPADDGDPEGVVVIVPGERVGPIRLGMPKAAVEALGVLTTHPQYSGMTVPYTVYYDDADRVHGVEVTLDHSPGDVQVGATTIPRDATAEQAISLLGDCAETEVAQGGNVTPCREGGVSVNVGSGNPDEVWLRVDAAP